MYKQENESVFSIGAAIFNFSPSSFHAFITIFTRYMHTIILINSYENRYISSNDDIFFLLMNSNNLPFKLPSNGKVQKKKKTLYKYIFYAYRYNCPLSRFRSIRHIIHFSLPVHSRPSIARLQFTLVCSRISATRVQTLCVKHSCGN